MTVADLVKQCEDAGISLDTPIYVSDTDAGYDYELPYATIYPGNKDFPSRVVIL